MGDPLSFVCEPRGPTRRFQGELQPCEIGVMCDDGLVCLDVPEVESNVGTCVRPCDSTVPSTCGLGWVCLPTPAPAGSPWSHVGYCMLDKLAPG